MEFLRERTPQPAVWCSPEFPTWRPALYISSAQVWLSRQVPSSLDPLCKYTSRCKVWGTAYVDREKLDIDLPTAEQFYQKLLQLENHFREKYREVRSKIRGK
ncbi:PREDICTED: 3-keto-steroid reductase-like [Branchiostoma belcheri]|uniref:3-keto-steroid reductase-like n=1 Tax=Branchiostoma belcheri TaxID=7741 RepID=A0A6P4XVN9_BRABE|nr:PREDICTED: 3-keto-steroid reductase-like [Branchiostoma belcheri]